MIDKVIGKSVEIERDSTFDTDTESEDSSVIQITIGYKEIHHVSSSMIVEEHGLTNVFDDYTKEVNVQNMQHGVPIVNSINNWRNFFTEK